jgi:hypothetical protein
MPWHPKSADGSFDARANKDGTVVMKFEVRTTDGYGMRFQITLDGHDRDELWEVLTAARSHDPAAGQGKRSRWRRR